MSTPPPTAHLPARSNWALEIAVPNVPTAVSTAQYDIVCYGMIDNRHDDDDYYHYYYYDYDYDYDYHYYDYCYQDDTNESGVEWRAEENKIENEEKMIIKEKQEGK